MFMKQMKLDYVWWLVAKQNPLKGKGNGLSISQRCQNARIIIKHPRILVTDIEKKVKSNYIIDSLIYLKLHYPKIQFIWLMGADNLLQFGKWKRWQKIFNLMPVMVYDRDDFCYPSLASKAALAFKKYQIYGTTYHKPPCWGMIRHLKSTFSSTAINRQKFLYEK
jgi:nicotinate-nucleotide adenylyltransferase